VAIIGGKDVKTSGDWGGWVNSGKIGPLGARPRGPLGARP